MLERTLLDGAINMKIILAFLQAFFEKSSLIYFALSCLLAIKGELDGHTTEVLFISCFFGVVQILINFKKTFSQKQP